MNKILQGLKEALSFARGECEHQWVEDKTSRRDGRRRYCTKCGVSLFEPLQ